MEFKERSDKKILDDIKSAGQTFLGLRMEDLLLRINELDDTIAKIESGEIKLPILS